MVMVRVLDGSLDCVCLYSWSYCISLEDIVQLPLSIDTHTQKNENFIIQLSKCTGQ